MTISPNLLHASINFDDFQHVSISFFLITFIFWKQYTFTCVYDPMTLALNYFYFDRLSKQGKFRLICASILEFLLCSCTNSTRIISSLHSNNYDSNVGIILMCIIVKHIEMCVENLTIKSHTDDLKTILFLS